MDTHAHTLELVGDHPGHFRCTDDACGMEWDDLHAVAHEYAAGDHIHQFQLIGPVTREMHVLGSPGMTARIGCTACPQTFPVVLARRMTNPEIGRATPGVAFDPARR